MKRIVCLLLTVFAVICFNGVFAANDITVTVNGNVIDFDQPPVIESGRTLVPMRAIFEALGCEVTYYEGEEKTVVAEKGLDSVSLTIGSDIMYLNYETEIILDVPARIENSRTLIPLRAVSEALGAAVEWVEDERAVIVESRTGAHSIKSGKLVYNEEGLINFEGTAVYPVIESDGDEFIDKINEEYKKEAESIVNEDLAFYHDCLNSGYEDYGSQIAFTSEVKYNVTYDRKGYISILTVYSTYTGGAHPNSTMWGRTFDLKEKKELKLRDVFNADTFDLDNAVAERIEEKVAEYSDDEDHIKAVHDMALEEIDNAGFYLTDDAVHVFYVPYQIASYAEGYLTADIYYDSEYINVDLSDYDWPELVYEVEGNPTTGYEWVLAEGSEKLDVSIDYIEPVTELVGAGGIYRITVKGLRPGNAAIKLEYKRSWEAFPIETMTYNFFVENDLGVTLVSIE